MAGSNGNNGGHPRHGGPKGGGAYSEKTRRCNAQRMNLPPGTLCKNVAGAGTNHPGYGRCRTHTGSTPNGLKHAQKEIAREEVLKLRLAVVAEGEEFPNLDPKAVLAEELYRTREAVRTLSAHINELAEVHGPLFHATGVLTGESKPHVYWVMLQEQRQHLKQIADSCHRAGIDVAHLALEKQKVEALLRVFARVYDALELTGEQRQLANNTAAQELRLLEGTVEGSRVKVLA